MDLTEHTVNKQQRVDQSRIVQLFIIIYQTCSLRVTSPLPSNSAEHIPNGFTKGLGKKSVHLTLTYKCSWQRRSSASMQIAELQMQILAVIKSSSMAAEANYNPLEDDKALCHQLLFRIQLKNFWKEL